MGDEELDDLDEGGEEEGAAGGDAPKAGFKMPGMSPMIVRILLVVLGLIVVTAISIAVNKLLSTASAQTVKVDPDGRVSGIKKKEFAPFDMGEFTQNTADTDIPRFIKVKVNLTYDPQNKKLLEELTKNRIVFRDVIAEMLAKKEYAWLQNADNRSLLKEEIMNEINSRLGDGEIIEVLFDDYMVN